MKKTNLSDNYLERIPLRNEDITWSVDDNQKVTLQIENKGFFNFIAQKFFKKKRISYVYLDEMGSFIWPLLDGKTSIMDLGKRVQEKFGEKCDPLYERLCEYVRRLESYNFVTFNQK